MSPGPHTEHSYTQHVFMMNIHIHLHSEITLETTNNDLLSIRKPVQSIQTHDHLQWIFTYILQYKHSSQPFTFSKKLHTSKPIYQAAKAPSINPPTSIYFQVSLTPTRFPKLNEPGHCDTDAPRSSVRGGLTFRLAGVARAHRWLRRQSS